jgi:L-malate glycosyltransferase
LGGTPVNLLAAALLDLGHQITLATLDPALPVGEVVMLEGPNLTIEIGAYRPRHRARDRFAVERSFITKALARHQPDVISAHWSYEFALGALDTNIPTLVTVHDVPRQIFWHQPNPYRLVRWWMHRQTLARADRLAFNSPYTQQMLGWPRGQEAIVLPNAVPDRQWVLQDRESPNPRGAHLVSVNNGFSKRKNVHRLIEAFAEIRGRCPEARLDLVGGGFESGGPAAEWAMKRGCAEGIKFIGPLDYPATLERISEADILVHPSLEESFGYTLIEAVSVGTPVIAGRASGAVPWVLGGGQFGVLVNEKSPAAIADAVVDLVNEPQRWSRLRIQAFEGCRERFASSAVAAKYVEVLRSIRDARPARTR